MNRCVSNYAAIILRCQNPVTSYEVCQRSLLGRFAAKLTNQLSNSSDSPLRYPQQLHPCEIGPRNHPEQGTHPPLPLKETPLARPLLECVGTPLFYATQGKYKQPPRYLYTFRKYLYLIIISY